VPSDPESETGAARVEAFIRDARTSYRGLSRDVGRLRAALTDAGVELETYPRSDQPFFHLGETHKLIETIAARDDPLTIFAGAGVSVDFGCPDWRTLVALLIANRLVLDDDMPKPEAREVATQLVRACGPIPAASVAMRLYEESTRTRSDPLKQIHSDLSGYLYSEWDAPAGPLLREIVRLAITWRGLGRDIAVITTNYDDHLEREAARQGSPYDFFSMTSASPRNPPDEVVPVYHLHGLARRDGVVEGDIVLSERAHVSGRELVSVPEPDNWREDVILGHLEQSSVLFVGTSLTDPILVTSLIVTSQRTGHSRYATFPRQADPWLEEPQDTIREALDRVSVERLRHLDVEPIRPDFFGQVAQFLAEVRLCSVAGPGSYAGPDAAIRYGQRMSRWWSDWSLKITKRGFASAQRACQRLLANGRDSIAEQLGLTAKRGDAEQLKLELWARAEPEARSLELWCSSEATFHSPQALMHRSPVTNNSPYVAVQAFCQGYVKRGPVSPTRDARWRSFASVPIELEGPPWEQLTVGVINLLSTAPATQSALAGLDFEGKQLAIVDLLRETGRGILDPAAQWPSRSLLLRQRLALRARSTLFRKA